MSSGWDTACLGDLSSLVTKGTTPTSIGHDFVRTGINFVKVESISATGDFLRDKIAHVSPTCHAALKRSQLQVGDILFSIAGALGRTACVTEAILPANTNQALAIIRLKPDANVTRRFVAMALETGLVLDQIAKSKGGVAQQNLSLAQVRNFKIPVPPLAEQQRIVGVLDEAFAGLATAQAHAEKNLQNARAIFESHLESVFTSRSGQGDERCLGDVCDITSTLVDPQKSEFLDLTHVGAGNIVSQTGVLIDLKTAREEMLISGKFLFDETMVLYSKIRPYLMKVALPTFRGLCSADIYPLAPNPSALARDYLYFLLLSRGFTEYAIRGSARAGMPKVNREHLFQFTFWLPDLATQKSKAARLGELITETQRLETLYQRKLAALAELKKSLLHQAFTGAL